MVEKLVGNVRSSQIRTNQNIRWAGKFHEWELLLNVSNQCGVRLHRSVDDEIRVKFAGE